GETRAIGQAIGTTQDIFEIINLKLARGRYFNKIDYDRESAVCVVGASVARQLFPYQDPLGQLIQVGSPSGALVMLEIVGVLQPTGLRGEGAQMMVRDLDRDIYFPLSLARSVFSDTIVRRMSGA